MERGDSWPSRKRLRLNQLQRCTLTAGRFCTMHFYIISSGIIISVRVRGLYNMRFISDVPCMLKNMYIIGASVSESHLGSSTRPLSVCLYISYVRHFWSRGPRATRKRKPAHLKFKGHMHACCMYVANASRAITTLIERLHMYSSSLITSSAG